MQAPSILRPLAPVDEIPNRTVLDFLNEHARTRADHPFLQFISHEAPPDSPIRSYSYAEFHRLTRITAEQLRSHGVTRGTAVGIFMRNSPEWLVNFFAVVSLGGIVVPINVDFRVGEVRKYLDQASVGLVVAAEGTVAVARESIESRPQTRLIVAASADDTLRRPGSETAAGGEPGAGVDGDDLCLVMFTSGTSSGRPKGVMLTHKNVYFATGEWTRLLGINRDDRIMVVTPLFHANALQIGTIAALMNGATLQLVDRFSASRFWGDMQRFESTVFWTMGGILSILLSLPEGEIEQRVRPRLRRMFVSGLANMRPLAQQRFCQHIMDAYGLTETAGGTYTPVDGSQVFDPVAPAVGLPLAHEEIAIVDEHDQVVPLGVHGEIVFKVKRGNLMQGYLGDPEATREAIRNGWFHTGDIGFISPQDGFLHFVDRSKDIIRRGSLNISAREIEDVILQFPGVQECAVVPLPHPVLQEVVMAYVTTTDPALDTEALKLHCSGRLARQKVPEVVEVRSALPRTPTGKVEKHLLRAEAKQRAASSMPGNV